MEFKNTEVWGFEGALRGMRNPKNSWDRGDSGNCLDFKDLDCFDCKYYDRAHEKCENDIGFFMGPNDMKLAQTLIKAGPEHRKFLRYIHVQADITAPLYWYKEYDTYKVATVANSTSTMHKITSQPIVLDCFETNDYNYDLIYRTDYQADVPIDDHFISELVGECLIPFLENLRKKYLETKDVRYWKELIRWLPESWLQTRTVDLNYETLRGMYFQRRNHKLTEWHSFCKWVESLPYALELICLEK